MLVEYEISKRAIYFWSPQKSQKFRSHLPFSFIQNNPIIVWPPSALVQQMFMYEYEFRRTTFPESRSKTK